MKVIDRVRGFAYLSQLYSRRPGILKAFRELKLLESYSREKILEDSRQRLSSILQHAVENVPYYRDRLGKIEIETSSMDQVLSNLPLLDAQKIIDHWESLQAEGIDHSDWKIQKTGGSTGEPVRVYQDGYFRDWTVAATLLMDSWTGYRYSEPRITLWGSQRDLLKGGHSLHGRISSLLRNTTWLNTFKTNTRILSNFVDEINRIKPVLILAYPESAFELARFCESNGRRVYSPRAIMTAGGKLYKDMRPKIEQVFNTIVFDRYGSREVGAIACECGSGQGLHVCPGTNFVEVVDIDGKKTSPGEVGEIVVTSLINYAMPLIRYRIGDMGRWADEPCGCGLAWPLLDILEGRSTAILITSGGDKVHGGLIRQFIYHLDWVKQYQVVQKNADHILIRLIPYEEVNNPTRKYKDDLERIRSALNDLFGDSCQLDFEFPDLIESSPQGKYHYVLSELDDIASN